MMNFKIDSKSIEDGVIQIKSRFMSYPTLSDIDFKNQMTWSWTTLNFYSSEWIIVSRKYVQYRNLLSD